MCVFAGGVGGGFVRWRVSLRDVVWDGYGGGEKETGREGGCVLGWDGTDV